MTNTHFDDQVHTTPAAADSMSAVVQYEYGEPSACLGIDTRPLPTPGPNEVLVRMAASPINPSDLMFLRGVYGIRRPLPTTPGFEATGTVIAAGPGLLARFWLGRRVACVVQNDDGCWAEYFRAPILKCLPVPKRFTDDQAATMLINPFTAWAMVDIARRRRVKAVVQTAAGSALGRMIRKLAAQRGIDVIDVVRREEQAEELRRDGAHYVIVSTDHNFQNTLTESCRTLGARLAFDAVGGEMTTLLASTMPVGGRILVYGALALEDPVVPLDSLIFRDIHVEGFFLGDWFARNTLRAFLRAWPDVVRHIGDDLHSPIRARYPLSQAIEAITEYEEHMSGGKILLVPD